MNMRVVGLVVILFGAFSVCAQAQLLNFDFSITGSPQFGSDGTITGEIIGLQNNAVSVPSDIILTSITNTGGEIGITVPAGGYSLAAHGWILNYELTGSAASGTFSVSDASITENTSYTAYYLTSVSGLSSNAILSFNLDGQNGNGGNGLYGAEGVLLNGTGLAGANFTYAGLTETPEVPTWILVLAGLAVVAFLKRRGFKSLAERLA